jgi:hypothetical protein
MVMRIEQQSCFLSDLLSDVQKGMLVPAAFQRPYVWSKADVIKMCESILEGYPFGSFLIWMPYGSADLSDYSRTRLGPIQRTASGAPNGLILDGQNRLASFAWMTQLLHEMPTDLSEVERETWGSGETLVVDLEHRDIRFVPKEAADKGFTLPAYALLDTIAGMRLMRERYDAPEWSRFSEKEREEGLIWWDKVASARIREARVVAVVLERATPEEALKAFTRICKVGVPMSQEDFEAALNWKGPAK